MRIISTLLLVVAAAGAARAEDDEHELVRQGIAALKDGDFEGALARFKDAQIENPESTELQFNIGLALYRLKRYDDAGKAFSTAQFSRNREIEKRACFHLGNCAFQQGKLQEALDHYNRAIEADEAYEDARVNREFVTRKIKELARKKKEQEEQQEKERQIVEKLQELVKRETALHQQTRGAMLAFGKKIEPTRVERLDQILNVKLAEDQPPVTMTEEQKDEQLVVLGKGQGEILDGAKSLLEEVRAKIEEAKAQPPAAAPGGAAPGGAPPADSQAPPNPEIVKLEKALPFLAAAEPAMLRARDGAIEDLKWAAAHAGQEESLVQLLKALDELLDELTKIIQDEIQLLKDTARTLGESTQPDETLRPEASETRDEGVQHATTQGKLRERTARFTGGLEQHVQTLQQQATQAQAPGQPGVQPGQDPKEQIRRFEQALVHLGQATVQMEEAEARLPVPELQAGLEAEKKALEELAKAKQALSPPQDGQGKDDKQPQKQDEKKQDPSKDDQQKNQPEEPGEDEPQENKGKPEEKKMSKEQAEKMLKRAKQQERDRRKKDKEKRERARGRGSRGVEKDW